jgi:hypothetical protein
MMCDDWVLYQELFMYFDIFYIQWHCLAKKDLWNATKLPADHASLTVYLNNTANIVLPYYEIGKLSEINVSLQKQLLQ